MEKTEDPRISYIKTKIKSYPDFPKKGVDFKDLFSAMRDTKALIYLIELSKQKANEMKGKIDHINKPSLFVSIHQDLCVSITF